MYMYIYVYIYIYISYSMLDYSLILVFLFVEAFPDLNSDLNYEFFGLNWPWTFLRQYHGKEGGNNETLGIFWPAILIIFHPTCNYRLLSIACSIIYWQIYH